MSSIISFWVPFSIGCSLGNKCISTVLSYQCNWRGSPKKQLKPWQKTALFLVQVGIGVSTIVFMPKIIQGSMRFCATYSVPFPQAMTVCMQAICISVISGTTQRLVKANNGNWTPYIKTRHRQLTQLNGAVTLATLPALVILKKFFLQVTIAVSLLKTALVFAYDLNPIKTGQKFEHIKAKMGSVFPINELEKLFFYLGGDPFKAIDCDLKQTMKMKFSFINDGAQKAFLDPYIKSQYQKLIRQIKASEYEMTDSPQIQLCGVQLEEAGEKFYNGVGEFRSETLFAQPQLLIDPAGARLINEMFELLSKVVDRTPQAAQNKRLEESLVRTMHQAQQAIEVATVCFDVPKMLCLTTQIVKLAKLSVAFPHRVEEQEIAALLESAVELITTAPLDAQLIEHLDEIDDITARITQVIEAIENWEGTTPQDHQAEDDMAWNRGNQEGREQIVKQIRRRHEWIERQTRKAPILKLSSIAQEFAEHGSTETIQVALQVSKLTKRALTQEIPNLAELEQLLTKVGELVQEGSFLVREKENISQPKASQIFTEIVRLSSLIVKSPKYSSDALQLVENAEEMLKNAEEWLNEGEFQDAELDQLVAARKELDVMAQKASVWSPEAGLDPEAEKELAELTQQEAALRLECDTLAKEGAEEGVLKKKQAALAYKVFRKGAYINNIKADKELLIGREIRENDRLVDKRKVDLIERELGVELDELIAELREAVAALS